jgi:xylulokinase
MPGLVVAVDLGTTASKAMLVDGTGRVIAEAHAVSQLCSPAAGWAEMDAAAWWHHVVELVPRLLSEAARAPADVAVVGVSGMVPTLVAVDATGQPLRPSIQQNDARAVAEIDEVQRRVPDAVARTGSAVTAQSIGPKWMWLQRHEPATPAATRFVLGSYGSIVMRLTGVATAEANWALESGLASLDGGWDPVAVAAADVPLDVLPPVVEPGDIVGAVTAEAAAACGLLAGTPVIAGCADHVASAYAAGLVVPGQALVKLGGAGDILLVTDRAVPDERLFVDRHPDPGRWLSNGCMASSGSLLRWFERELAGVALADLDRGAAAIPAGAGGLLVLPYFLGEKTPIQDPLARGVIAGLHLGHTRAHVHRALLEAVAFGFEHHFRVFAELGLAVESIVVTNGGSRSSLWKQIIADVTGRPLGVPPVAHGSCYGTAMVAGRAAGLFDPVEVLAARAGEHAVIEPDLASHAVLQEHYQRWRTLDRAVRPISHDLARVFE